MTPCRHQVGRNPAVQRAPDWSSPMRILRELGYVENQNFDIVYRSSGGNQDRLPTLAEELAQLKPDVILAIAIAAAVLARKAISTNRDGRVAKFLSLHKRNNRLDPDPEGYLCPVCTKNLSSGVVVMKSA